MKAETAFGTIEAEAPALFVIKALFNNEYIKAGEKGLKEVARNYRSSIQGIDLALEAAGYFR